MVAPIRFLWLGMLSVRSGNQLDPNYIKLPADTDRVIDVAWNYCNSENTFSKFFESI